MSKIAWARIGERRYETGVDRGVLYIPNSAGEYDNGYAWNGLTTVTESPSGAEPNKQYADNRVYVNLVSNEEFEGTIEAFMYPDEFGQCDGTAEPTPGVAVGQQSRKPFGLAYRTKVGNDTEGTDFGYKIHLIYGAMAKPSEKSRATINESPEAMTFSWEFTTDPVDVPGINPNTGKPFKPTSHLIVDSTVVDAAALVQLEELLYGTEGSNPELPPPGVVIAMFNDTIEEASPVQPTYDSGTHTITIPTVTGVEYRIDNKVVTGDVVITKDTVVVAKPKQGYKFPPVTDDDWVFKFA